MAPFYVINHSVLSSTPISTQLLPRVNHSTIDHIQSPLSSPDDDLDFNSPGDGVNGTSTAVQQIFTIDTKYNPSLERNTKVEYEVQNRLKFTEKERGYATKAKTCTTLVQLTTQVSHLSLYITYFIFYF